MNLRKIQAALTSYWPDLERQICVAGSVEKIAREESENYFKSRPRGSQIASWASNQSKVVADCAALEAKWNEMERKFSNEFPLPLNWGGFVLKPERIEFWQGRASRLYDRFHYMRQPDNSWNSNGSRRELFRFFSRRVFLVLADDRRDGLQFIA